MNSSFIYNSDLVLEPLKFFRCLSFLRYPRAYAGPHSCSTCKALGHFSAFVFLSCYRLQTALIYCCWPLSTTASSSSAVASRSCWYLFLMFKDVHDLMEILIIIAKIKGKKYFMVEICACFLDFFRLSLRISRNLY